MIRREARQARRSVVPRPRDPHPGVLEDPRDRSRLAHRHRHRVRIELREHRPRDAIPKRFDQLVLLVHRDVLHYLEDPLVVDGLSDAIAVAGVAQITLVDIMALTGVSGEARPLRTILRA